jgi:hypothetical protein
MRTDAALLVLWIALEHTVSQFVGSQAAARLIFQHPPQTGFHVFAGL